MARNVDFAFLFRGGANNALLPCRLENLTDVFIDTAPYESAKKAKNSTRQLFTLSTGAGNEADGNLQPHLDKLMAFVRDKTGQNLETVGAFVIVGSSNGASLALALAAQLTKERAPKLSYVGVCNVNIFPSGRNPPVPNIGTLMPGKPVFATLSNKARSGQPLTPFVANPLMDMEDPPRVTLDSAINADKSKKRNFFEKNGNHVKFVKRPPANKFLPGWWWHSSMPGTNEVHGEVDGFDDEGFVVTGADDFAMHNAICTGNPFDKMLKEASAALAGFPD